MPTLLIGPSGFAPIIIGGGGGGGGGGPSSFTGVNGTPNLNGTETGPNGLFSASRIPLSSLVVINGDVTLTSPTTMHGYYIKGRVINHSTGSTLQSCVIAGGASSGVLVDCTSTAAGALTLQDCIVRPDTPASGYSTGVIGGSYTAIRTEVRGTIDGFGAYNHSGQSNCDVKLINCISHLLYGWLHDPGQKNNGVSPGPSHNDCLQFQGGNNMWVLGCGLSGYIDTTIGDGATWNSGTATSFNGGREFGPANQCNSCIQTNENNGFGITSGVRIEGNYLEGGSFASLNIANNSLGQHITIDTFINNMFNRDQGASHGATQSGDNTYTFIGNGIVTVTTASNNVYFDDLVAINMRL